MKNIIDTLVGRFNSEDAIKFSDKDNFKENKSWAITGSPELEYNLGILGYPTGIIEIAGVSKSGKTTLALVGMANFLKKEPEGIAILLSSENRDNKEYALKLGVDPNRVMILKIRFVEDMFMKVKKIITDTNTIFAEQKLGKPKFYFMWDSLGATLSKAELDTMEENTDMMEKKMAKGEEITTMKHEKMGAFAKNAKMFAKFIIAEMYNNVIHFVILNHVYDMMSGQGGKKSGGGTWIEFLPCIRLRTTVVGYEKLDDEEVAQYSTVKIVKNDFGSRKETKIEILLGKGIVLSEKDILFGVEQGIIKKESAKKMSFMTISWMSKRTLYSLYYKEPKIMNILHTKIHSARHKQVIQEREQ